MTGFLIDTNVISEFTKSAPNKSVIQWMNSLSHESTYLSVLTVGEIHKGILMLTNESCRMKLKNWVEIELLPQFSNRILSIDESLAERWGHIAAEAQRKKITLPVIDGLLAATAIQHNLVLVTRNKDVHETGVSLINPWKIEN